MLLTSISYAALNPITNVTATPGYDISNNLKITISWSATSNLDPLDTAAAFVYNIYVKPGLLATMDTATATLIGSTDLTSLVWYPPIAQDYTIIVEAVQNGGLHIGDKISSNLAHNYFVYEPGRTEVTSQQWKFNYKIQQDAYVNLYIYDKGTVLNEDSKGHPLHDAIYTGKRLKKVIDAVPRPRTTSNEEVWDCRTDTGMIVPNGIYWVLIEAMDRIATDSCVGYVWDSLPVDILRITNVSATAITASAPTSYISYTLSGDATVYIRFYKPGTQFNTAGYPVNPSDQVNTKTVVRGIGSFVESWGGVTDTGAVLPNGLYIYNIRAYDVSGNASVDTAGNDCPMFGTIPIDRTATGGGGGDTTAPTISGIYPGSGAVVTTTCTQVSAALSDAGGVNWSLSTISLTGPAGSVSGSIDRTGVGGRIYLTFSSLATNGDYTISVTAYDNGGLSTTSSSSFKLSIGTAGETIVFKESVHCYPNPATSGNITFTYYLTTAPAEVTIEVYTVMGELLWSYNATDGTGGTRTVPWSCVNSSGNNIGSDIYVYRVTKKVSGVATTATKKLIVIR